MFTHLMALGWPRPLELTLTEPPPWVASLRDIHPGPSLVNPELALRWQGWLWCLLAIGTLALLGSVLVRWRRYRQWCQPLACPPALLVSTLHSALRHAALVRWPQARTLQGAPWLHFLDQQGGGNFAQFSDEWLRWLYGQQQPPPAQARELAQQYRRLGRRLIWGWPW
ncbi:DUF4381 domain-containing protein, partial [Aeromonas cavernicola]